MKEWMAQAYPPKEANTVKKMNGQLLLFFPNKMTHYFKVWTIASGVLKKINCLYKNLQQFQRTAGSRKKIRAINTPKEQLFEESSCS